MSDIPITITGPVAAPVTYTLSPLERWTPTGVSATFDGSGAAGDFLPCCSIYSQSGVLLGRMYPGTVKAGDVAEVTYSPFSRAPTVTAPATGGDYIFVSEKNGGGVSGAFDFSVPQDARQLVLFGLVNMSGPGLTLAFNASAGPYQTLSTSLLDNAGVVTRTETSTADNVIPVLGSDTYPAYVTITIPYYRQTTGFTGFRDRAAIIDVWQHQDNVPSNQHWFQHTTSTLWWVPTVVQSFLRPAITRVTLTGAPGSVDGRMSLYKIK